MPIKFNNNTPNYIVFNDEVASQIIYNGEVIYTSPYKFNLLDDGTYEIGKSGLLSFSGAVTLPAQVGGKAVTKIADEGFLGTNITSITIPDTIKNIGSAAFECCSKLTTVSISSGSQLETIGNGAFAECTSLTSFYTGEIEHLHTIGASAFSRCTALQRVYIPMSVDSIGDYAFEDCTSLTSFELEREGSDLAYIGEAAFYNCYQLEVLPWSNVLEEIGQRAFATANIAVTRYVYIPESVNIIGSDAFSSTYGQIYFGASKYNGNWEQGCLRDHVGEKIYGYNPNSQSDFEYEYNDEDGITIMGYWGNSSDVIIPLHIENKLVNRIGYVSAEHATYLYVPGSCRVLEGYACGDSYFEDVYLEYGVEELREYAFQFGNIRTITLPESLQSIGRGCFECCQLLEEIYIPESVEYIEPYAFVNAYGLVNIQFGLPSWWGYNENGERDQDAIDMWNLADKGDLVDALVYDWPEYSFEAFRVEAPEIVSSQLANHGTAIAIQIYNPYDTRMLAHVNVRFTGEVESTKHLRVTVYHESPSTIITVPNQDLELIDHTFAQAKVRVYWDIDRRYETQIVVQGEESDDTTTV